VTRVALRGLRLLSTGIRGVSESAPEATAILSSSITITGDLGRFFITEEGRISERTVVSILDWATGIVVGEIAIFLRDVHPETEVASTNTSPIVSTIIYTSAFNWAEVTITNRPARVATVIKKITAFLITPPETL